jgi:hypothetical protein
VRGYGIVTSNEVVRKFVPELEMFGLVLAALFALSLAGPRWHELEGYTFEQYEQDFNKEYKDVTERVFRRMVFEKQLKRVTAHNKGTPRCELCLPSEDTTKSWKEGVNRFSDWTRNELKAINGGVPSHKYVQSRLAGRVFER